MALLDLADRWRREKDGFVAVGHVNHGLRGKASRADAVFVQRFCRSRNLPCYVRHVPVKSWAKTHKKGLEESARILRYQTLAHWARRLHCNAVATGHTLNDQVETIFMNLLRGTGPAGLTGMAAESPWPVAVRGALPRLLRPLLSVPRRAIESHLKTNNILYRKDATNDAPVFLRNRLRPTLNLWEKWRPGFMERVAQTARLLRDEEDYWRRRLTGDGKTSRRKKPLRRLDLTPFLKYPIVEQRRRLRLLFGLTHFESVERVRAFAEATSARKGGPKGPLDLPGVRVEKAGRHLLFRPSGTISDRTR
jgi:tRNA(Ile)-lysidine synthetase-like protein